MRNSIFTIPRFVCALAVLGALMVTGCGPSEVQQKLDFAQQTVKESLEAWKGGGSPEDLKSSDSPVEFYDDDWLAGAKLIDFEIGKVFLEPSDQTARCSVILTVQRRKKKASVKVGCTYQVVAEPAVVVARDPMS